MCGDVLIMIWIRRDYLLSNTHEYKAGCTHELKEVVDFRIAFCMQGVNVQPSKYSVQY